MVRVNRHYDCKKRASPPPLVEENDVIFLRIEEPAIVRTTATAWTSVYKDGFQKASMNHWESMRTGTHHSSCRASRRVHSFAEVSSRQRLEHTCILELVVCFRYLQEAGLVGLDGWIQRLGSHRRTSIQFSGVVQDSKTRIRKGCSWMHGTETHG